MSAAGGGGPVEWLDLVRGAWNLSPAAAFFIMFLMYQRGDFVSKREHQETRADRDLARKESKEKDLLIRELVRQNAELLSGGKVAVEVSKALPNVLERGEGTDGSTKAQIDSNR